MLNIETSKEEVQSIEARDLAPIETKELSFREQLKRRQGDGKLYGSVHDLLFRLLMSDRFFAIDFFQTYTPEWAEVLDFENLTISTTEMYSERLQKRIADYVVKVPYKAEQGEQSVEIAIVVEHKAQSQNYDNKRTIGNLVLYVASESVAQIDRFPRPENTPQALALLVYNGSDPNFKTPVWKKHYELPSKLRKYSLEIEIPCINLAKLYQEGKLGGSPLVETACTAMACAGLRCLKAMRRSILKPLNRLKEWNDTVRSRVNAIILYIVQASSNIGEKFERDDVNDLIADVNNQEVRKEVNTVFDDVRLEGEREGMREGKRQGKREGMLEATLNSVYQGLAFKYPNRPVDLDSQIAKISSLEQLNSLFKFIFFESKPLDELIPLVNGFLKSSTAPRVTGA